MKKSWKKFVSIVFVCIMLFCMMPTIALAKGDGTENNPYVPTNYSELRDLLMNAPNDGTTVYIKLEVDIESKDIQNDYALTLTKKNQSVVLDLAGHSITRESNITVDSGVIRAKEGVLTIKDSVGTGGVYAKGRIESAIIFKKTDQVYADDGTINIYGGTYQSYSYNNIAVYNECGDLYIYGGNFKGSGQGYGIFAAAGKTIIYGGSFYAETDDGKAVYLGTDQYIELYNLTAYGKIDSNSAQNDIWQYLHYPTGRVFIDGVELTDKSRKDKFIGDIVEIKTEMIDKLEITVTQPVAKKEIDKTAYAPVGAKYKVFSEYGSNVVAWFEGADGDDFAGDVFEKNTVYRAKVYVEVSVLTMPNLYAEINGNKASVKFTKEEEGISYYWLECTFPATEDSVLKNVDITIPTPVGGTTINGGNIYNTNKYNVAADWHSSTASSDYGNLNGKSVPYGKTIYATVYLQAQSFYEFSEDTKVVINNKEYEWSWFAGPAFTQYIQIQNVAFQIPAGGYLKGDINGNGTIDSMDYLYLKRAFFKQYTLVNTNIGDINNNGAIDSMDYLYLKRAFFKQYVIE